MAKKNKTPEPILNAPVSVPIKVVKHGGPNRDQRRHEIIKGPKGKGLKLKRPINVPKSEQISSSNAPHRRDA